ncbi:hypothetical protein [Streptomyces sp. NPDC099088]|uniref:hypothetical protein n=1 Tax=Streptomyces sp. NPDC099088 TaxID=3366101 RepID=UPI00381077C0
MRDFMGTGDCKHKANSARFRCELPCRFAVVNLLPVTRSTRSSLLGACSIVAQAGSGFVAQMVYSPAAVRIAHQRARDVQFPVHDRLLAYVNGVTAA